MNWDDLRYFLYAVRTGSYSAAAQQLRVNRTTVARRINNLEERLGKPLFVFHTRNYSLSPAGRDLYQHARQLEQFIGTLEQEMGLDEEQLAGKLNIAAPLGLGPEFLPQLAAFSAAFPQVEWELINSVDPLAALTQRKADVAIALGDYCPPHLRGASIGPLPRALYASKRYLKKIPAKTPLEQHHWIGWGKDLAESNAARWMAGHLPENIRQPVRVNSWQALKEAVLSDLGVAPLWCFLADQSSALERIRPPLRELSMGLWLFQAGDIPANARLRAFFEVMVPALRERVKNAA